MYATLLLASIHLYINYIHVSIPETTSCDKIENFDYSDHLVRYFENLYFMAISLYI